MACGHRQIRRRRRRPPDNPGFPLSRHCQEIRPMRRVHNFSAGPAAPARTGAAPGRRGDARLARQRACR
ncbi:MAG: hypothetical protein MZW92_73585 [Comamonadaceae bacterium]|nr:hypothetical protein [Comamonadaceae bacterium]